MMRLLQELLDLKWYEVILCLLIATVLYVSFKLLPQLNFN
jgi:hypothetical protein